MFSRQTLFVKKTSLSMSLVREKRVFCSKLILPSFLLFFLFSVLLTTGCSTAPVYVSRQPEWSKGERQYNSEFLFFTGYGEGSSMKAANRSASENLYNVISGSLRIPDPETPGLTEEQREIILNLKKRITKVAEKGGSGGGMIKGLKSDRKEYWTDSDNVVHMYLRVRYRWSDLTELKNSLYKLFPASDPEVVNIELMAQRAVAVGSYYEAMELYSKAAFTAIKNSCVDSDIVFKRDINKAGDLAALIRLEPRGALPPVYTGRFNQSFLFNVKNIDNNRPVPYTRYKVVFKIKNLNGAVVYRRGNVVTESTGVLKFHFPQTEFEISTFLKFTLTPGFLPPSHQIPMIYFEDIARLTERTERNITEFKFDVIEDIASIPMGIVVVDTDKIGTPLQRPVTEGSILSAFKNNGYNVSLIDLDYREILENSKFEMARDLSEVYGDRYERVIFGKASLSDFKQQGDLFNVTTKGEFYVVDVKKGIILMSRKYEKRAGATDTQKAISLSFQLMARDFVSEYISTGGRQTTPGENSPRR